MARIAFMRGSPQRIHYSRRLTLAALLALLVLSAVAQVYVFHSHPIVVVLYVFTIFAGLYLGAAMVSRWAMPVRLRSSVQAALLLLAAAHVVVLLTAPFSAATPWLPMLVAAVLVLIVAMALTNCVQYAMASARSKAVAVTVAYVGVVVAFYATMLRLLAIVMS